MFETWDDEVTTLRTQLATERAAHEEVKRDAERWRALIGCDRVRVLGEGRRGYPEGRGHLGVEFWGSFPDGQVPLGEVNACRDWLTMYADALRASLPSSSTVSNQ